MKKLLLVTDSHQVDSGTIDFGCYLAEVMHSDVRVLLVKNVIMEAGVSEDYMPVSFSFESGDDSNVLMDTAQSTQYIKARFRNIDVSCEVVECARPSEEILLETRFADLLVLSPELSFSGLADDIPSPFVKYILASPECPVVLSPRSFTALEEIVFCYDGSASSMFAIKQFTYIFPELRRHKVSLLEVRSTGVTEEDDAFKRTFSWLTSHYDEVRSRFLQGSARDELFTYFLNKDNVFIVMGAFGRSMLSNFFRKSAAELVIKTINQPLFIAHH